MNFLRKTSLGSGRRVQSDRRRPLIIIAVVFVLIAISAFVPSTPLKSLVTWVSRPFWSAQEYVVGTADSALTSVRSRSDLLTENAQLNQKVQEQAAAVALNQQLQAENDELKAAFGRNNHRNMLLVATLGAPGVSAYDTIVVDAGANLGIQKNAQVFFSSTTVAGHVAEVYPTTALVRLYSDPDEEVVVYAGEKRFFTKATGQGGGNFLVNLPHDSGLKEGDFVMVPGTPGLILGVVGSIQTDIAKSLQVAHVLSPYNASQTHFLYVQK